MALAMAVAVVEPLAVFRRALSSALDAAGFETFEPDNLEDWLASDDGRCVVVSITDAVGYKRLEALKLAQPDRVLLALVDEPEADDYCSAFRAGASAVADRSGDSDQIMAALRAALEGFCCLPVRVAHRLAARNPAGEGLHGLCPLEVQWLRALAKGVTVHQLAEDLGYSERVLFRMLHGMYQHMGVETRSEAIALAGRWGLLDD